MPPSRNQTKPSLIFDNLVAYLWEKRIEIPTYYQLKTLIQEALETVEKELNDILKRHLNPQDILLLDNLFQKSPLTKISSGVIKYELTLFKKIPESMENQEIMKRVEMFIQIKAMYEQLFPVIKRLDLSHTTIRYNAEYVIDTQTAQLKNNLSQRNLWLITFIIHQYFSLGDALVLTFQKAVKMALNGSENRQQGNYWNSKPLRTRLTATVSSHGISNAEMLTEIERISHEILLTADVKIAQIQEIYRLKKIDKNTLSLDIERIKELQNLNSSTQNNDDYYKELEKVSFRLQLKLAGMLEYLQFSMQNINHPLLKSIAYFQANKANITHKRDLPIDFLSMDEQQRIYSDPGKLKVSLYKMLFFKQIQEHLKSGELHVENSYNYQALRPRIANLKHKELFSIDAVSTYKEKGYKIVPHERANIDNIIEHWDDILRVVCSIKLGHTKASDLFRRLNRQAFLSYDRQNPLYKALSDLGRLLRTIYILRYIDDPEIRASVEEVLANGEHGNVLQERSLVVKIIVGSRKGSNSLPKGVND